MGPLVEGAGPWPNLWLFPGPWLAPGLPQALAPLLAWSVSLFILGTGKRKGMWDKLLFANGIESFGDIHSLALVPLQSGSGVGDIVFCDM